MAGGFGLREAIVPDGSRTFFASRGHRISAWRSGGLLASVFALAVLERMELPWSWIAVVFLIVAVGLHAGIGIVRRATDAAEYYAAGSR